MLCRDLVYLDMTVSEIDLLVPRLNEIDLMVRRLFLAEPLLKSRKIGLI